jgi:hypothetical protein
VNCLENYIDTNYFVAFADNSVGIVDGKVYDAVSVDVVYGKVYDIVGLCNAELFMRESLVFPGGQLDALAFRGDISLHGNHLP